MQTPNPCGTVRDKTWEKAAEASVSRPEHWSWDRRAEARNKRKNCAQRRAEEVLAELLG